MWEEHKEEIRNTKHISYVPIKNWANKDYFNSKHNRHTIGQLLMITKIRNRYYVSKEKLEIYDPSKIF